MTMEELLDILTDLHPDVDFRTRERLFDDHILDSMDIVSLIAELGDTFDVTITARDIRPENFNSAKAMFALISRLEAED